jgi:hypothetical protein
LQARTEQPWFTPGFPLEIPLQHEVRIGSLNGPPTAAYTATTKDPIVSDTKQLAWYTGKDGLVTVETDRTESLVGFIREKPVALRNLSANLTTTFASLVLSSMDGKPLGSSGKLLLTAGSRVSNTGLKWNETRTRATGGQSPSLIEPVTGTITLRRLNQAKGLTIAALDGSGHAIGAPIRGKSTSEGWTFPIGSPVTTWYVISVER